MPGQRKARVMPLIPPRWVLGSPDPSGPGPSPGLQPCYPPAQSLPPAGRSPPRRDVQPVAVFLHHLVRRAADEVGVAEFLPRSSGRPGRARSRSRARRTAFGGEVDHVAQRQDHRRLVQHQPAPRRGDAAPVSGSTSSVPRASRQISVPQACRAGQVVAGAASRSRIWRCARRGDVHLGAHRADFAPPAGSPSRSPRGRRRSWSTARQWGRPGRVIRLAGDRHTPDAPTALRSQTASPGAAGAG